ncbi:FxsA family protein [Natrialba asiatica]|uniref:Phage T7 F exclusion suppressor FxsA n=1 Tax=Natrialba asiatica (strain ATCC 700177 / DSM 12278 / JCM 9576 / FERM P-10747 / NBRC 102637 / 172P1) TaxID=29540 RepID=M0AJK0_NATA1|nr:FxsA family protein [Natrialba asiatica]ELY98900.1 phage T7 F exclusion suppressor FxsA [Natrialba asiatica DSM 12278]
MLRWIFALLLIPFLDAVLLAVVVSQTSYIGWIGMVLLVVLTGLVGMLLVRAEGRRTLRKMQRSLARGEPPTNQLLDGGLLIAAGAFLLTPGLVTDLIGFLIAVPITRIPIRAALKRYVIVPYADKKTGGLASGSVWTFGFPNGDPEGTAGTSTNADAGTYDLGADDYTVNTGTDGQDSYSIDLGGSDESTENSDDEEDDSRYAR